MVRDFPEQQCQVPTPAPRFCHSRKGAQTVSGGFWRDLGLRGGGGRWGSSRNRNKT